MEEMECDYYSDEEIQALIKQFMDLTGCTYEFASEYLSGFHFDIESAIELYYQNFNIQNIDQNKEVSQVTKVSNSFKIVSWNLDGLDMKHLEFRTQEVANILNLINPDFVFIQELVKGSEKMLRVLLSSLFEFFVDDQFEYYCAILVRKNSQVKIEGDFQVLRFPNSNMGRSLLSITVLLDGDTHVRLLTSHLESMKDGATERKAQFRRVLDEIRATPTTHCVVFAGDTNLRDYEVTQVGLPADVTDVAQSLAGNAALPTWEPAVNLNISRELAHVRGLRFDRMFVRAGLTATQFNLVGKEMIAASGIYASDHWGIVASLCVNPLVRCPGTSL